MKNKHAFVIHRNYNRVAFLCFLTLLLGTIATYVSLKNIGSGAYADVNQEAIAEQRNSLIATADAYYAQGEQLQYDSYRKITTITPEDATAQHTIYTVCSGFVYATYLQALGIVIPNGTNSLEEYANKYHNDSDIVLRYYDSTDDIYSNSLLGGNIEELTNSWSDFLRPGDVINMRWNNNGTGHAMLVRSVNQSTGEVEIIHSSGHRYDYANHEDRYDDDGIIKKTSLYDLLVTASKYSGMHRLDHLAVIRFVTNGSTYKTKSGKTKTYNITESAQTRLNFPNIDIEKTATVTREDGQIINSPLTAAPGDTISYTIKITNKSSSKYTSTLNITEQVDPSLYLETVDNGGIIDDNKAVWHINSLNSGASKSLHYDVKIPRNGALLNKVIISNGTVNNIHTSKIETRITNGGLTAQQKTTLWNAFNNSSSTKYNRSYINDIYNESLGINPNLINAQDVSHANHFFIGYDVSNTNTGLASGLSVRLTKIKNNSNIIYSNFYGLQVGDESDPQNNIVSVGNWQYSPEVEINSRARNLTIDMLEDGDIILTEITEKGELSYTSYIVFNGELYNKSSSGIVVLSGDDMSKYLNDAVGKNFIVMRPAQLQSRTYQQTVTSISIKEPIMKTKYIQNSENIDLTGGKLLVQYDDGTSKEISMNDSGVSITGFNNAILGNQSITVHFGNKSTAFVVEIINKTVVDLAIKASPDKTVYVQGDNTLDLSGGALIVTYNDASTSEISMMSPNVRASFSTESVGDSVVTLSYGGQTTTFTIKVNKSIVRITVTQSPLKTTYIQEFDNLDLDGGKITATYSDETTEVIDMSDNNVLITGFNNIFVGTVPITATYGGKSAVFEVTVVAAEVKSIELTQLPGKLSYAQDDELLDLTGGKIAIAFNNDSEIEVPLDYPGIIVSGFNNSEVGEISILVKYSSLVTSFNVQIVESSNNDVEAPKTGINEVHHDDTHNTREDTSTTYFVAIVVCIFAIIRVSMMVFRKINIIRKWYGW